MSLHAAVAGAILALGASYAMLAPGQEPDVARLCRDNRATAAATGMAVYRAAVVAYYSAHPDQYGSVAPQALADAGALPSWSSLQPGGVAWRHFRDGSGLIYIYAGGAVPSGTMGALLEQSQHSALLGRYQAGQPLFVSAQGGATALAAPPAALDIPNGSPLWLAQPN